MPYILFGGHTQGPKVNTGLFGHRGLELMGWYSLAGTWPGRSPQQQRARKKGNAFLSFHPVIAYWLFPMAKHKGGWTCSSVVVCLLSMYERERQTDRKSLVRTVGVEKYDAFLSIKRSRPTLLQPKTGEQEKA
jgi:hypothetical protein